MVAVPQEKDRPAAQIVNERLLVPRAHAKQAFHLRGIHNRPKRLAKLAAKLLGFLDHGLECLRSRLG